MTRINLLPPKELHYKHLLAELRELPRVFSYVNKYGISPIIAPYYTLNKGHVKFFTNKLQFLFCRYCMLHNEATRRGYNINFTIEELYVKYSDLMSATQQIKYTPTPEEIKVSQQRTTEKLKSILSQN